MALEELLGDVGAEVGGLVPAHMVVVHIDVTQLAQNVDLILACRNR